ncbi:hypothetical protein A33Q_0572 [Indibacter alkaliphilus LW1]|uniref:Uncharacterized protein n=1 Tax=Indibacter alkaliphilus (strain CCUG 57479 / KCTC 22604 / LW1) TaxID=1189612 RepID=S2DKX3_INDAL|nr:hypothetical protein A33Q_0572 [Indibacter alkaliphilus LW1]
MQKQTAFCRSKLKGRRGWILQVFKNLWVFYILLLNTEINL